MESCRFAHQKGWLECHHQAFAQTIKIVVRDKISQGSNEKEIYEFLSEKYGEWIVYKPKFNYINSLLWISPYIVLILGGYLIFKYFRKRRQ